MFKNIFRVRKSFNNYRLPTGYEENLTPSYYVDNCNDNLIYQPHVYKLGQYFADRANIKNIIDIGSGNGLKLIPFLEEGYNVFCVDMGENIEIIKNNLSKYNNITYIKCDLSLSFPQIDKEIINDSIIIAADVIEHILSVDIFLKWLSKVSYEAKYLLISTPDRDKVRGYGNLNKPANLTHVREWNANELKLLLIDYSFNYNLFGHTINTNHHKSKTSSFIISGREISYKNSEKIQSVLAIINVYNEVDIIVESVEYLLSQGVDVYIYDDNSIDGTYELLLDKYKHNNRVFLNRREKISKDYDWEELLKHTELVADEFDYDWFMHCDADEIRYSPWEGVSIQEAVSFIDSRDYNAVDFTVLDFRFIRSNSIKSDFENNLLAFEFGRRAGHFSQIKLWKKQNEIVDLHSSGGHEVVFKYKKIYPIKFLLKHYPLRNMDQLNKKVFNDRAERIQKEQTAKGWHAHYNDLLTKKELHQLPWEDKHLLYWNNNICKDEFLIELISGIGLVE